MNIIYHDRFFFNINTTTLFVKSDLNIFVIKQYIKRKILILLMFYSNDENSFDESK